MVARRPPFSTKPCRLGVIEAPISSRGGLVVRLDRPIIEATAWEDRMGTTNEGPPCRGALACRNRRPNAPTTISCCQPRPPSRVMNNVPSVAEPGPDCMAARTAPWVGVVNPTSLTRARRSSAACQLLPTEPP